MTNRLWTAVPVLELPHLNGDIEAETVIVGGGITGLMTAYLLAKAGKRPVLIEKDLLGNGETGSTTAFLTYSIDVSLLRLKRMFGAKRAAQVWRSGKDSIDLIEKIVRTEKIECEFTRCPMHVFAVNEKDADTLRREAKLAESLGFPVRFHESGLSFEKFGYLEFPNQAKFHPQKFLLALARAVLSNGGQIFVDTTVTEFTGKNKNVLVTDKGKVTAHHVVVATHSPIDNPYEAPMRLVGYQSYVIAATATGISIPEGLYIDTEDPYHYLRIDQDRIMLGGEDHVTGRDLNTARCFSKLETHLKKLLGKTPFSVTHQWSGIILHTPDGLPYIGPSVLNKHHFIATGFAGNGMTFGTVSGMIISDLLLGKENAYAKRYTSKRLRGLWHLTVAGWNVFSQWLIGLRLFRRQKKTKMKAGEGRIISLDGKTLAVSCAASGKCTAVSAVCTHLGCNVQWNQVEKTWDCPCHASRFTPKGDVINGPALKPLERFPDLEQKLEKM